MRRGLTHVLTQGTRTGATASFCALSSLSLPSPLPSLTLLCMFTVWYSNILQVCAERCVREELSIAERERIELDAASHIAWVELVTSSKRLTQRRLHARATCHSFGALFSLCWRRMHCLRACHR